MAAANGNMTVRTARGSPTGTTPRPSASARAPTPTRPVPGSSSAERPRRASGIFSAAPRMTSEAREAPRIERARVIVEVGRLPPIEARGDGPAVLRRAIGRRAADRKVEPLRPIELAATAARASSREAIEVEARPERRAVEAAAVEPVRRARAREEAAAAGVSAEAVVVDAVAEVVAEQANGHPADVSMSRCATRLVRRKWSRS